MKKIIFLLCPVVVILMAWQQDDEFAKSKARGKEIYEELCVTCHLVDGTGTPGVFPPLANADFLIKKTAESIHAIKYGQEGEIIVNGESYNSVMPAPGLSDQEVADVMNYIQNSWGNKGKFITVKDVEKVKK